MTQKICRCVINMTMGILVAVISNLAGARTNYTDLWWNASESGWGVTMSQDYNGPIFATFFVYAANGTATWVVALLTIDPVTGVYSGALLETSGGAPLSSQSFNPTAVQGSNVGTVTFTPADATNGTLAYTYRGSSVVKQITRQPLYTSDTISNATFLTPTPSGTAYRAIVESRNNAQCSASNPANTSLGTTHRIFPTVVTSNSISLNIGQCDPNNPAPMCVISTPICTFTGAVNQIGRVLSVPGTLSCTTGTNFSGGLSGNFTATFSEVEHTVAGDNGKLFVTNGSCNVQSIILIQRNDWLNSLTL
jgi:hypothetical protein